MGRNLQDHLCVSFYYRANVKTLNDEMRPLLGKLKLGLQYLLTRKGPLAMSVNQSGGFFKGSDSRRSRIAVLLQSAVVPHSEEQQGE